MSIFKRFSLKTLYFKRFKGEFLRAIVQYAEMMFLKRLIVYAKGRKRAESIDF